MLLPDPDEFRTRRPRREFFELPQLVTEVPVEPSDEAVAFRILRFQLVKSEYTDWEGDLTIFWDWRLLD
jgi:hypothetical protein